ncbi:hypothetical protein OSB04_004948 [Centaurea solstitialis]|uniref:CCHC-type domain-containing protein n=1 Tax=Centaurea solstitialis TaxID=347529 RepID=A0AA38TMM8_9ASTR|nr:hypothetical protein OSB04_004948 [Centaurea solstitialis]
MDSQEGVFANKVPMLKPNEFDMWKIRIRQHMLLIDYSMWDVIENGPAERKAGEDGVVPPPRTDAERKARQIEMKALSTLLFAIPNEYQHQFMNCENAKVLWQALERRFAGSKSTKRNQKAILRQQYENFMSTKNETMTQTFDRYNKLIGELVTVGVKIDNDDINRKFLRSLGEEWTMYTVSLRQSEDLEDKELDDLYNDLRVFEAEVEAKRKPIGYSHNTALLSNESSQFNDSNSHNSGASESFNAAKPNSGVDQTLEAFLASHVKTSLINEDLEQISPDDLEEMDIKWQMAMLTMRIKRFIKRTGRNNFGMKREDGAGFDKSKVRCYKCNDLGHFARECKGNASQHNHQHKFNKNSNGSSSQALVSQEGFGFDWSDQADEAVQNQALMAEIKESSSSEIPSEVISKLCSKSCIDTVQKYRDHNQSMCDSIKKLEQFRRESNEVIGSLEDQIKAYQANELQFEYDQNYWKWEKKEYELKLSKCRSELEKVRVELEQSKSDLEKFSKASKAMDEILKAQINDDLKRGIGYHTTPPPYNNNYIPPKSNFADRLDTEELKPGLTEVDPVEGEVEDLGGEGEYRKKEIEESVPDDNHILTNENGGRPFVESNKVVKEKGKSKIDARSSECDPSSSKQSQYKRGNQRNWNNQWAKSHGIDLSKINRPKPCFICCKLNHLAKDCYFNPINHRNSFQNYKSSMIVRKKQQFQAKKVESINKKVVSNQNRKFQSNEKVLKKKVETKSVKMTAKWVPKAVVHNIAATSDKSSNNSESNKKITTASCSSTPVNTASSSNKNNATPVITASTPEKKKPYIVTKYSIHEIPSKDYMLKLNRLAEFKYVNDKGKKSEGFNDIVDFLQASTIAHAILVNPKIYIIHQKDFWRNARVETLNNTKVIQTTVSDRPLTVSESTIRRCLHLDDEGGETSIPTSDIFPALAQMGYEGSLKSLKIKKKFFGHQWKFLVHILIHCFSKKSSGWDEFGSTIASALVCLATSRRFNFSNMIFENLVANLDPKSTSKSFYMYPRFVQEVINLELPDVPATGQTYNRNDPSFKMFSNMKRSGTSVFTPLFPTMMGVIPPTGEASGLQPTHLSTPPDDLPTPTTSNVPQSPVHKTPSPALQVYIRKIKRAPSSFESTHPQPKSPLVEHSPLEFIQRETKGVSPNSNAKEVPSTEMSGHVDGVAHTTGVAQSVHQDSVNINKTPSTATLNEKSFGGPRCQETMGVDSVSTRLKTATKIPKDLAKKGSTSKAGEGSFSHDELMAALAAIAKDLKNHDAQFQDHASKHEETAIRMEILEKMVKTQNQLVSDLSKKCQAQGAKVAVQNMQISALQRRYATLAAFTKGEKVKAKGELKVKSEVVKAAVSKDEKKKDDEVKEKEPTVNVEERVAAETALPKATPKVIPTKGIVIKEKVEVKKDEKKKSDPKDKGKGIMIEEPKKKIPKHIPKEIAEEMSLRKIVSMMTEDELERARKEAAEQEASLELAKKLQQEEEKAAKKSIVPKSKPKKRKAAPKKVTRRTKQVSKAEERKSRIKFLVNAVGGTESMYAGWSDEKVEERYNLERDAMQQKKEEEKVVEEEEEEMPVIQRRSKRKHDVAVVSESENEKEDEEKQEQEKETEKEKDDEEERLREKAAKRKKSIAHKKSAKKAKLVHDSAGSEIIDWDSQGKGEQMSWVIESKGGKLDTHRSTYHLFSRLSIVDLKKLYEIGCVKDPKGRTEIVHLIEDLKVMFAFEKSRDDYRKKESQMTCEAFGGVGATAWSTFKRNRVVSISFKTRQYYFLLDKRYDFDHRLCTSLLDIGKKKSVLSDLDKEFVERINQRIMQFDDDFDPEVIGKDDGAEKKVKEWFVRELSGSLYYKVIWEDGKASWGGILADILKEYYFVDGDQVHDAQRLHGMERVKLCGHENSAMGTELVLKFLQLWQNLNVQG